MFKCIFRKEKLIKLTLSMFLFGVFAGCATVGETGKKIWGTSIAHLEAARPDGKSEKINLTLQECFDRTEKILNNMSAVIYPKDKDKRYLVAMNFKGHVDTTQVGIFFTKIEDQLTQVEVASMSPSLVDEVAALLFPELKK